MVHIYIIFAFLSNLNSVNGYELLTIAATNFNNDRSKIVTLIKIINKYNSYKPKIIFFVFDIILCTFNKALFFLTITFRHV